MARVRRRCVEIDPMPTEEVRHPADRLRREVRPVLDVASTSDADLGAAATVLLPETEPTLGESRHLLRRLEIDVGDRLLFAGRLRAFAHRVGHRDGLLAVVALGHHDLDPTLDAVVERLVGHTVNLVPLRSRFLGDCLFLRLDDPLGDGSAEAGLLEHLGHGVAGQATLAERLKQRGREPEVEPGLAT